MIENCLVCGVWKASGAIGFKVETLSGEEKEVVFCENCAREVLMNLLDHVAHGFPARSREEILRMLKDYPPWEV